MLTVLGLWATAVATVWGGCYYAGTVNATASGPQFVDLDMHAALVFPISASLMLLLLFYYFWLVQYILLALLTVSSFIAVADITKWLLERLRAPARLASVVAVISAVCTVWQWVVCGDWVAMDVIGISLGMSFIASVRFPSLRIATICLSLLFAYDFYWVYLSKYNFAKNVMVEVAQKQATSPVSQAASYLGIETLKHAARTIELPIKLLMPGDNFGSFGMLGLGDIVLPGVLCNYAYRADFLPTDDITLNTKQDKLQRDLEARSEVGDCGEGNNAPPPRGSGSGLLFACSLAGYGAGLAAAFWASLAFHHPQPALIFIVPSVLLSLSARAAAVGRLSELWHGSAHFE